MHHEGNLVEWSSSEKSGPLPGIDHKSGNKAVVLELDSKENKCFNLRAQRELTNVYLYCIISLELSLC